MLKPGAFFALTEHGLGELGDPHNPLPWSEDGSEAYLMRPADTVAILEKPGFSDIQVTNTGKKYLQGYLRAIELAEKGEAPVFGVHILLGRLAPQLVRNAARNIEEGRTHPVQKSVAKDLRPVRRPNARFPNVRCVPHSRHF